MTTFGVTDYTNQTPSKHFGWIKCQSPKAQTIKEYLSNMHNIKGVHVHNCYYAKFEH